MLTLRARFVVPVAAPVIEGGGVVIDGDRIVDVGRAGSVTPGRIVDYGDAVILPGLINAHTHLELSHLLDRVSPTPDFAGWLGRLMHEINAEPPDEGHVKAAMGDGVWRSLRAGVTTVGDITRHPSWTREVLVRSPLCAVSFGEVISVGMRRHLLEERLSAALDPHHASNDMHLGVSPHAPYTVEPPAMRRCAEAAQAVGAPLCIHLAETREEEAFTKHRTGPLADCLRDFGVWDDQIPVGGAGPVRVAFDTGVLTPRTIAAHVNYASDEDIEMLASSGASVAYCPRTHQAFGHDAHRFRDMIDAGVNVCLGTDSLASNPSLSVLEELRFLRRCHTDLSPELLLRMATINGARALGLLERVGSLRAGLRADVVVMGLGRSASSWADVFDEPGDPLAVYARGIPVD